MEAIEGFTKDEVLSIRKESMFSSSTLNFGDDPIMTIKGEMQYLYDEEGNNYLDGMSSSTTITIGHCHKNMKKAIMEQIGLLTHMTQSYLNPSVSRYLLELMGHFPVELCRCFLMNSGSEANDLAILMSKLYTGKSKIISFKNSYHGNLGHAMAVTEMFNWHHSTILDTEVIYLDPFDKDHLINILPNVACCIFEPIQGVGGIREIPKDYITSLVSLVRANDGLIISDEVQTGFGRTGDNFWGYESYGFVPDIVTFGKGAGNGYPLAGVVTREEISNIMKTRTHFNTYGGNPISCNVGYHVLKTIEEERLLERVRKMGIKIKCGLSDLVERYSELLKEVRGKGLMLGLVCVGPEITKFVVNYAKNYGLLLGMSGRNRDVITLKPPYCISEDNCEFMILVIELCLVSYQIQLE